jgi:hypothetical protein
MWANLPYSVPQAVENCVARHFELPFCSQMLWKHFKDIFRISFRGDTNIHLFFEAEKNLMRAFCQILAPESSWRIIISLGTEKTISIYCAS